MALPGVKLNVLDGSLNLQAAGNAQTVLYLSCGLGGTAFSLLSYGDQQQLRQELIGGELAELANYGLDVGGGPVMAMPMPPTVRGGIGPVVHVGGGTGTMTVTAAPQISITVTTVIDGVLGVAAFAFKLGNGLNSPPVISDAAWSSTGYRVPGTYVTLVFVAGTYHATTPTDVYVVGADGVVSHPSGTGPAVPTFTASPVDEYELVVTIVLDGALGTMQFTYTLDGTVANTSSTIISSVGGVYAIPGSGLVLTFAGTFFSDETYSARTIGPTFSGTDLAAAFTLLKSTYLAQSSYAMIAINGAPADAAAWAAQATVIQAQAEALFNLGVFVRCFNAGPTVGTIHADGTGDITIDSADTDSIVVAARATVNTPRDVLCAGDWRMSSTLSGLEFRRNAMWAAAARASAHESSEDIGAVQDGAVTGAIKLYRDENATPAFDAAGIVCLRTFTGGGTSGVYITEGLTGALATSDFYRLANGRVIDVACGVVLANARPLVLAKIPTTTRNNFPGVITERKAQQIEGKLAGALHTVLIDRDPADATDVDVVVNRTHNVLSDGQLILSVSAQPFAYARTVTANIGLKVIT